MTIPYGIEPSETGCRLVEVVDDFGNVASRSIICRVRTEDEILAGLAERDPDPEPPTPRDDFGDPPDGEVDFDDHDADDELDDDGADLLWGMSILRLDEETMTSDMLGSGVLGNHHRIRDRVTVVPDDISDL